MLKHHPGSLSGYDIGNAANTQALRGLALLTSVTAWPNFSMGKPLQGQLLRLEEAFDETANGFTSNLGIIIPFP